MSSNPLSTGSTEATDRFLAFIQKQMDWKKSGFVKLSEQISMEGEQGSVYFIRLSSHLSHQTLCKWKYFVQFSFRRKNKHQSNAWSEINMSLRAVLYILCINIFSSHQDNLSFINCFLKQSLAVLLPVLLLKMANIMSTTERERIQAVVPAANINTHKCIWA